MGRVLVTPPVEEPLTRNEVKVHLRIDEDQTEEDGLIDALIKAARVHVENETARAMLTQTWKAFYDDRFPFTQYANRDAPFVLYPTPLQSVAHIKYYDSTGALTTLAGTEYFVDTASEPGRVLLPYNKTWPATQYPRPAAVEVQFVAGYANVSLVPPTLKAAMKLLIGTWYEQREGVVVGTTAMEIPQAVDALLAPHRLLAMA